MRGEASMTCKPAVSGKSGVARGCAMRYPVLSDCGKRQRDDH